MPNCSVVTCNNRSQTKNYKNNGVTYHMNGSSFSTTFKTITAGFNQAGMFKTDCESNWPKLVLHSGVIKPTLYPEKYTVPNLQTWYFTKVNPQEKALFLLIMSNGDAQDIKIDEWLQTTNCVPGSPVELDFCTCKCTELTAALRASPDMQLFALRRMKARRSGAEFVPTPSPLQGVTPGVVKCWETCVDTLIQRK